MNLEEWIQTSKWGLWTRIGYGPRELRELKGERRELGGAGSNVKMGAVWTNWLCAKRAKRAVKSKV